MNGIGCYRVTVTDNRGRVVIDWKSSVFSRITVNNEGGKTVIAKKGIFGTKTYTPAMNESVQTSSWFSEQFNRAGSKR
jgi:hypothetical protein